MMVTVRNAQPVIMQLSPDQRSNGTENLVRMHQRRCEKSPQHRFGRQPDRQHQLMKKRRKDQHQPQRYQYIKNTPHKV